MSYKIIRFFQNDDVPNRVHRRGLTLEQAQKHCRNPETSSSTCERLTNRRRTERHGPWFDGYEEE